MYNLTEPPVVFRRPDRPDMIIIFFPSRPFWFVATPEYEKILTSIDGNSSLFGVVERLKQTSLFSTWTDVQVQEIVEQTIDFLKDAGVLLVNGKRAYEPNDIEPHRQITEVESVLVLEITRRCNLYCPHCYASAGGRQDKSTELTPQEICKILADLQKLSWAPDLSDIGIIGGEPFVRRDIFEIVECIRAHGYGVLISSNGLLIRDADIDKLSRYERLQISISLDGSTPQVHEFIRGRGTFERTVETIRKLVNAGIDVGINVFVHQRNLHDLPEIINLALSLGVKSLNANTLMMIGRGLNSVVKPVRRKDLYRTLYEAARVNSNVESLIENSTFANKMVSLASGIKTKYCGVGSQRAVYVRSNGDLYPCGNTCVPYFFLGNLKQDDISEIWMTSPKLLDLRKTNVDTLNSKCATCIFRYYCGGDCRGEAYQATGDFSAPHFRCDEIQESIVDMMWMFADTPHFLQKKIMRTKRRIQQAVI